MEFLFVMFWGENWKKKRIYQEEIFKKSETASSSGIRIDISMYNFNLKYNLKASFGHFFQYL